MTEYFDLRMPVIQSGDGYGPSDEADQVVRALTALDEERPWDGFPITVTLRSPRTHRRAVWRLATYFRREFHYDFVQYGHQGCEDDEDARAFLWFGPQQSANRSVVIGACCFRWREWSDAPPSWALQWIWFHPYERHSGHLGRAWPYFRQRFGDFVTEEPLSPAMTYFLEARGERPVPDNCDSDPNDGGERAP